MRIIKSFTALTFALLAFSYCTVSAQSFTDTKAERTLEQKVYKEILGLPRYEVFDYIGFTVDGSTVTLYGKVRNAVNRSSAENVVEDLPGVTNVVNNIEVLPLGTMDETIRRNLYRKLSRSAGLTRYFLPVNPSVRLIVDHGNISLEGYVTSKADSNLMNIYANGIPGAFSVTNNLIIDSGKAR